MNSKENHNSSQYSLDSHEFTKTLSKTLERSPFQDINNTNRNLYTSDEFNPERIHALAEGIRNHTITDADILQMSLQKSAKRSKAMHSAVKTMETIEQNYENPTFLPSDVSKTLFREDECKVDTKSRDTELQESSNKIKNPSSFSLLSNGDILYHALERSARKKKITHDVHHEDEVENKNRLDSQPIRKQSDDNHNNHGSNDDHDYPTAETETYVFDEERQKSLKKQLKSRILLTVEHQMMDILNHGSFEELTELHGIGNVRAKKIIELRETREITLDNLEDIGMSQTIVKKLFDTNVGTVIYSLDEM